MGPFTLLHKYITTSQFCSAMVYKTQSSEKPENTINSESNVSLSEVFHPAKKQLTPL